MHDKETEGDTLQSLMAGLETYVSTLSTKPSQEITSKVDPVPPPVKLAALPGPTTPVVHEPVPAPIQHVERATLTENVIVQWLVQQAVPWNYQQQVLDSLHKIRLGGWQLALVLLVALGAGVATGYVAVPQSIVQSVRGTYQGFACPAPSPAQPTQPVTATPTQ